MITFNEAVQIASLYTDALRQLPGDCPFSQVYITEAPEKRTAILEGLIRFSTEEVRAYDGLRHISAELLRRNEPLPDELRSWLVSCLSDRLERPGRRGRISGKHLIRDEILKSAVTRLVDMGLSKTRNAGGDPVSACDAVAQAVSLSYEAVVSILNKKL